MLGLQRVFPNSLLGRRMYSNLLWLLLIGGWVLLAACSSSTPTPTPDVPDINPQTERQLQIFDELDVALKERFIYADFGGFDWDRFSAEFRSRIETGLRDDEFYAGLADLVNQLPSGTASFSSREERISSESEDTELYEGIGAFVSYRGEPVPHIVILSVMLGSPAETAGLLPRDSIYTIDGLAVTADEGISAVERIRGPRGSTVQLEVSSPNEEVRKIRVTRDRVLAADVPRGGVFEPGIYYLLIPVNAGSTLLPALQEAYEQIEEENLSGLILDLRIAHSTTEWPINEFLISLTHGQLGTVFTRSERNIVEVTGQDISGSQTVPLVVLIGPDTSGTPEIFASAIGEGGRATVIGMPTPGHVFGFEQVTLIDGSVLVFAASSFENLDGIDLAQSGVIPEILVEVDWDQAAMANDPVLVMAIETVLGHSVEP